MSISTYPAQLPCFEPFSGFCHGCGGSQAPCKETRLGFICSECRECCAWCQDWLLGDAITLDGKDYHVGCAEAMREEKAAAPDYSCSDCGKTGVTTYSTAFGPYRCYDCAKEVTA